MFKGFHAAGFQLPRLSCGHGLPSTLSFTAFILTYYIEGKQGCQGGL